MKQTTRTYKTFSGYFMSVEVDVENKKVLTFSRAEVGFEEDDSLRLRDTAEALIAAADLLDSLK